VDQRSILKKCVHTGMVENFPSTISKSNLWQSDNFLITGNPTIPMKTLTQSLDFCRLEDIQRW
jgi:hypothetical protein